MLIHAALLAVVTLAQEPASEPRQDLASWLTERVQALQQEKQLVALAACVITPAGELQAAAGQADAGRAMTATTPLRIASNTKTFVAAAALCLWEKGELDLEAPIEKLLPDEHVKLLRGDGYKPEVITVRQLATHTGGIFDHAATQEYLSAVLGDPQHRWTPLEQLQEAVKLGDPVGAPGERFRYADTGYVLLGQILERRTQHSLAAVVRGELEPERLGLETTWWERVENAPEKAPARAHQFIGERDVTDLDPSVDLYGGGGLVSNAVDLARFFHALFGGRVFEKPSTLEFMLAPGALPEDSPYRFGLFTGPIAGHVTYSHSGFWGTEVTHVPDLDATIAIVVTRQEDFRHGRRLLTAILVELAQR